MSTITIYDKELAPLVIKHMPTEIHLNLGDDLYTDELNIDFNDLEDITWSEEKCTRTAIRYTREDETKYIGKKDIEGNKIYADRSIVEFQDALGIDCQGYLSLDTKSLQYYIVILNNELLENVRTDNYDLFEFKIIDTIQENKLGLIK